nr:hypothetical protein GCM10020063_085050 [Dactylosporangium thailandense]
MPLQPCREYRYGRDEERLTGARRQDDRAWHARMAILLEGTLTGAAHGHVVRYLRTLKPASVRFRGHLFANVVQDAWTARRYRLSILMASVTGSSGIGAQRIRRVREARRAAHGHRHHKIEPTGLLADRLRTPIGSCQILRTPPPREIIRSADAKICCNGHS